MLEEEGSEPKSKIFLLALCFLDPFIGCFLILFLRCGILGIFCLFVLIKTKGGWISSFSFYYIFFFVCLFLFQERSLLNASLTAATGNLQTAVTGKNTLTSIPVTSHISAKSEVATNPTHTPAPCASTWRSTANPPHHLPRWGLTAYSLQGRRWGPLCPLSRTQAGDALLTFLLRWPTSTSGMSAKPAGPPTTSVRPLAVPHLQKRKTRRMKRLTGTLRPELFIKLERKRGGTPEPSWWTRLFIPYMKPYGVCMCN